MKIKFNLDDDLPLNKTLVRAIFYGAKKYYPQVFLDEFLCKL